MSPIEPKTRFLWNVVREAGASLLTAKLYPLGWLGKPIPHLPVCHWNTPRQERPILFIHGIFHNPTAFSCLTQRLTWLGWKNFCEINLSTSFHSIPHMAKQVKKLAETILEKYNTTELDIVAHSMGGIVARQYVQKLGGDGAVRHLITLGTPHQGIRAGRLSVFHQVKALAHNGPLIQNLNNDPPPQNTQGLAIRGQIDLFTEKIGAGEWPGVRNIQLSGLGHAGLLYSKRVSHLIGSRLLA